MTLEHAIEVFVRGFAFTRSFTHPYLPEQIEHGVWFMRDAARSSGDYRCEEYVARRVPPGILDSIARMHTRGNYRICVIRGVDESDADIRAEFKAIGYRLMNTEPFMIHSLDEIAPVAESLPVIRVATVEAAQRLAKAARRKQILAEHITADPPPMRQYMVLDGNQPVGWVGSIMVAGCAWCSSLYVEPDYRRRGIASTLLKRMLLDDRSSGAMANVLLASHTGAKLYPTVGYQQIGELLMFNAPK